MSLRKLVNTWNGYFDPRLLADLSARLHPQPTSHAYTQPAYSAAPVYATPAVPAPFADARQLLVEINAALSHAQRSPDPAARTVAAQLNALGEACRAALASGQAGLQPAAPASELARRLIAHKNGAVLHLVDLLPALAPHWQTAAPPPVLLPQPSTAAPPTTSTSHSFGPTTFPPKSLSNGNSTRHTSTPHNNINNNNHNNNKNNNNKQNNNKRSHRASSTSTSSNANKRHAAEPPSLESHYLKTYHDTVIHALYDANEYQCAECALRFATRGDESREHADWHFARNRRAKQRQTKPGSRQWGVSVDEWSRTRAEGEPDEQAEADARAALFAQNPDVIEKIDEDVLSKVISSIQAAGVPVDENQKDCPICGDPFDEFWSEQDDQW
eukprot:CAMPEP_0168597830 /NCGR_PEP_ID=MMETSP0420-20121227/10952_1 /TAXON_ID=498008 /ORGANISM="Pessonella sp." /LENGTH=384 /DNA_ID=CAMNT_0008634865 /DNA_START=332 /DNA_END=1483 /DNA_ORIENTATION=+